MKPSIKEPSSPESVRDPRRFPAEWEHQDGILLCYPHKGSDWPGKYQAIEWAFVDLIAKIAATEKVYLLVADTRTRDKVHGKLEKSAANVDAIHYIQCRTNRSWMRDSGPIVVYDGEQRLCLSFNFNAWAKYPDFRLDRTVPARVADDLGMRTEQIIYRGKKVVLEGGAIDSNGKGSLLATRECLLDPSTQTRNPGLTNVDYERIFHTCFGVTHTIWLCEGIEGDDTHGHVDDCCRFVNPDTIAIAVENRSKDPNYQKLKQNREILRSSTLENGRAPTLVEIPMPAPIYFDGLRLPASYANFLILNKTVLVPTFNDPNDGPALNILEACFPGRQVIGIHSLDLIWGLGSLHCLSQPVPAPL
ncbi:agmatine deiminase family protein [Verrucomicrobia bacterium]|nr:agmatine deiminase family protein [Verrucomicrobiota bacterium]